MSPLPRVHNSMAMHATRDAALDAGPKAGDHDFAHVLQAVFHPRQEPGQPKVLGTGSTRDAGSSGAEPNRNASAAAGAPPADGERSPSGQQSSSPPGRGEVAANDAAGSVLGHVAAPGSVRPGVKGLQLPIAAGKQPDRSHPVSRQTVERASTPIAEVSRPAAGVAASAPGQRAEDSRTRPSANGAPASAISGESSGGASRVPLESPAAECKGASASISFPAATWEDSGNIAVATGPPAIAVKTSQSDAFASACSGTSNQPGRDLTARAEVPQSGFVPGLDRSGTSRSGMRDTSAGSVETAAVAEHSIPMDRMPSLRSAPVHETEASRIAMRTGDAVAPRPSAAQDVAPAPGEATLPARSGAAGIDAGLSGCGPQPDGSLPASSAVENAGKDGVADGVAKNAGIVGAEGRAVQNSANSSSTSGSAAVAMTGSLADGVPLVASHGTPASEAVKNFSVTAPGWNVAVATLPASSHGAPLVAGENRGKGEISAAAGGSSSIFAAMDGASATDGAVILQAGPRQLAMGVADPALGWLEVRAERVPGHIAASITADSAASHTILTEALPGIANYLQVHHGNMQHVQVESFLAGQSGAGPSNSGDSSQDRRQSPLVQESSERADSRTETAVLAEGPAGSQSAARMRMEGHQVSIRV